MHFRSLTCWTRLGMRMWASVFVIQTRRIAPSSLLPMDSAISRDMPSMRSRDAIVASCRVPARRRPMWTRYGRPSRMRRRIRSICSTTRRMALRLTMNSFSARFTERMGSSNTTLECSAVWKSSVLDRLRQILVSGVVLWFVLRMIGRCRLAVCVRGWDGYLEGWRGQGHCRRIVTQIDEYLSFA